MSHGMRFNDNIIVRSVPLNTEEAAELLNRLRSKESAVSRDNLQQVCDAIEAELGGACLVQIDVEIGECIETDEVAHLHVLTDDSAYSFPHRCLIDVAGVFRDGRPVKDLDALHNFMKAEYGIIVDTNALFALSQYRHGSLFFHPDVCEWIAMIFCEEYLDETITRYAIP